MFESVLFKIRMECDECGSTVFLTGPSLDATCQACWSKREISRGVWKLLIEDAFANFAELVAQPGPRFRRLTAEGVTFVEQFAAEVPQCRACRVPLDLSLAATQPGVAVHCTACGSAVGTEEPPDWLLPMLPRARLLIGSASPPADAAPAPKPVLMNCLNCGAKLEIDSVAERITSCGYCEADHYLPEDVWRRLHPMQRRVPWYLVCAPPRR